MEDLPTMHEALDSSSVHFSYHSTSPPCPRLSLICFLSPDIPDQSFNILELCNVWSSVTVVFLLACVHGPAVMWHRSILHFFLQINGVYVPMCIGACVGPILMSVSSAINFHIFKNFYLCVSVYMYAWSMWLPGLGEDTGSLEAGVTHMGARNVILILWMCSNALNYWASPLYRIFWVGVLNWTCLAWSAGQQVSGIHLSLYLQCWGLGTVTMPGFYVGFGDPNSGPQTYRANPLPTEPSYQSLMMSLYMDAPDLCYPIDGCWVFCTFWFLVIKL